MPQREDQMDYVEAGADLRKRRERRTWSREELAERANISASAIRNYETGQRAAGEPFKPNRSKLRKIAEAFGWPEGSEILEIFGEHEAALQFERELLSDPDDMAALTGEQQEKVREIHRLILALVTDRD